VNGREVETGQGKGMEEKRNKVEDDENKEKAYKRPH